ncbi:PD-(D/E)XK motif protein [Lysobacter sp. A421]
MTSSHPAPLWGRLRARVRDDGDEVSTLVSPVDSGYGRVRYALGAYGEPRLLVPCSSTIRLAAQEAQNLSLELVRLTIEGNSGIFIDLTCVDGRLESVFAELASEILKRLQAGASPSIAVTGGIRDFRDLLSQAHPNDVSDEVIAGLVGELFVLSRLCNEDVDALHAWTGPDAERHDFRRARHAIEVKTSLRADRKVVSIHGIEQLSAPSDGTLVLFHVRIERTASGLLSVGKLVDDLIALGIHEPTLRTRLGELGCHDHHANEWNRRSFNLEGVSAYNVGPGFPAITREAFAAGKPPSGLTNIAYDVDLQFAAAFELDDDGVDGVIERFLA